jgi:hypothetical protein
MDVDDFMELNDYKISEEQEQDEFNQEASKIMEVLFEDSKVTEAILLLATDNADLIMDYYDAKNKYKSQYKSVYECFKDDEDIFNDVFWQIINLFEEFYNEKYRQLFPYEIEINANNPE